jgi:hypothetical protein
MKKVLFVVVVVFIVLAGTTFATSNIVVKDSEIAEMVNLCIKNNGFTDPDHIEVDQLILWEFPDNHKFQFYERQLPGQSLWRAANYWLIVTSDYHKRTSSFVPDPESVDLTQQELKMQEELDSLKNSLMTQKKIIEPTVNFFDKEISGRTFVLLIIFLLAILCICFFWWKWAFKEL